MESDEAQQAFTLLALLVDPDDRVALRFWLGLGSPTWCAGEYGRLRTHCETAGLSPRAALDQLMSGQLTITRTGAIQKRYRALTIELAMLRSLGCAVLVDRLFPPNTEWAQAMRDTATSLLTSVSTPAELLEELRAQITQPEMPEEGDFVRVMSLHKSKGLTSKVAIIAGCIEGLVPTTDSSHTHAEAKASLQEQRRLFYVSMTRCRDILVLSSVRRLPVKLAYRMGARVRGRRGVSTTIASRFLAELGPAAPAAIRGEDWVAGGFV